MCNDIYIDPLPEPRQARSKQKVQLILDTAAILFEEKGVASITTNDIATTAKVPVGSVYHYFPDKNAILTALMRLYIGKIEAIFTSTRDYHCLEQLNWQEIVRIILEQWSEYIEATSASTYSRFYRSSPPFREIVHWQRQELWKKFADIIRLKSQTTYSEKHLQTIAATCLIAIISTVDAMQDMQHQGSGKKPYLLRECSIMVGDYLELKLARDSGYVYKR